MANGLKLGSANFGPREDFIPILKRSRECSEAILREVNYRHRIELRETSSCVADMQAEQGKIVSTMEERRRILDALQDQKKIADIIREQQRILQLVQQIQAQLQGRIAQELLRCRYFDVGCRCSELEGHRSAM